MKKIMTTNFRNLAAAALVMGAFYAAPSMAMDMSVTSGATKAEPGMVKRGDRGMAPAVKMQGGDGSQGMPGAPQAAKPMACGMAMGKGCCCEGK